MQKKLIKMQNRPLYEVSQHDSNRLLIFYTLCFVWFTYWAAFRWENSLHHDPDQNAADIVENNTSAFKWTTRAAAEEWH